MGRYFENQDLLDYVKKLEERIAVLERNQRSANTSVDRGSITVNNGAIVAKHPNGQELFRTGTGETVLPFEVDPTDGYVTRITRASGVKVFEVFSSADGSEGMMRLFDRQGNQIVSEDYLHGRGLGSPFIPWHSKTMAEWNTPPTVVTSGTFVGTHGVEGYIQHPALGIAVRVVADAATAGEVRLQDTFFGTTMWSGTITTAMNGTLEGVGNIHGFRAVGNRAFFELQARRTSGAGNIRLSITDLYGRSAISI